jgi:type I restriction enzyme S subunit
MKKGWKKYKIGEVLFRVKDSFEINELEEYKRVTVRGKGKGISLRDKAKGIDIGTKRQFRVTSNQFLISKIDAMNGAFGIIPEECENAIITGNFWTYDFDEQIISKEYLHYLSIACVFSDFSKKASSGTTNRKYLDEGKFYNLEIELPPLPEQKRIVKIIQSVEEKQQKVNELNQAQERDIKNLLYSTYTDIIKGVEEKPMVEVAPLNRRKVEVELDTTYKEIGVRSFGKGTFEKPSFKGRDLTWQKPYWMKEGDLLFSNIKAWEGALSLIKKNEDGKIGSHRYITCEPNKELVRGKFLLYQLLLPAGLERIGLASVGTADRNRTLSTKRLEAIKVPVPKIEVQEKFERLLHQFDTLTTEKEAQEKELTVLIPSLLDKAFKGEL